MSTKIRLALIAAIPSLVLSGCAGVPVGWGGTYKVLHADSDGITIQYDSVTSSYDTILGIAKDHCRPLGGRPVVINVGEESASMGLVKTYTFMCKRESGAS